MLASDDVPLLLHDAHRKHIISGVLFCKKLSMRCNNCRMVAQRFDIWTQLMTSSSQITLHAVRMVSKRNPTTIRGRGKIGQNNLPATEISRQP